MKKRNIRKSLSWISWVSSGAKQDWPDSKWTIIIYQGPLYKEGSAKMQKHVKGPPWGISQLFYIAQVQSREKLRIWFTAIKKMIS